MLPAWQAFGFDSRVPLVRCQRGAPGGFAAMMVDQNLTPTGQHMDAALLSALAALAGSIVGGLTSGFTNWLNQRAQTKASLITHALARREELFKDFIVAASRSYGEATVSSTPQVPELVELYGMISRMRVMCSPHTVACAERVMAETIATYSSPNRTFSEIHEWLKSGTGIDPLKDFAEAARAELQ